MLREHEAEEIARLNAEIMEEHFEGWGYPEEWPNYAVSDMGRVKNMRTGRELTLQNNGRGVVVVNLTERGRTKTVQLKKLVAELFVPKDPAYDRMNSCVISHIDEDWTNCEAANLRWSTRMEAAWIKRVGVFWDKPVLDEETGMVYDNAVEAARAIDYGCDITIAMSCADGGGPTGRRWTWV